MIDFVPCTKYTIFTMYWTLWHGYVEFIEHYDQHEGFVFVPDDGLKHLNLHPLATIHANSKYKLEIDTWFRDIVIEYKNFFEK